jgi:hypothetical protein
MATLELSSGETDTMEGTLFALGQFGNPSTDTRTDYMTFLENNFGELSSVVNKYCPVALFNSTPFPAYYAISTVITENRYFCPVRRALEASINAGIPVWIYRSAHSPTYGWEPSIGGIGLELLGATHRKSSSSSRS